MTPDASTPSPGEHDAADATEIMSREQLEHLRRASSRPPGPRLEELGDELFDEDIPEELPTRPETPEAKRSDRP